MNNSTTWAIAWKEKTFRKNFIISFGILVLVLASFSFVLQYAAQRKGMVIEKGWMNSIIAPKDFSLWIFICMYSSVILGVVFCFRKPSTAILLICTYAIMQLIRAITLIIVPLDPPQNIISLNDPFLLHTFYNGNPNMKDLFFSGHIATIVMFIPIITNKWMKYFLIITAFLTGIFLAIQQVHYIIDIIAAPVFAMLAFWLAKKWTDRMKIDF